MDNITLTDGAITKLKELIAEEDTPDIKLRIFITGGGCSGLQYGFTFDDTSADDDTLIGRDGITILIDSMSLPYLSGATIDYQTDLNGSTFAIKNPNATAQCGCGSSFSI